MVWINNLLLTAISLPIHVCGTPRMYIRSLLMKPMVLYVETMFIDSCSVLRCWLGCLFLLLLGLLRNLRVVWLNKFHITMLSLLTFDTLPISLTLSFNPYGYIHFSSLYQYCSRCNLLDVEETCVSETSTSSIGMIVIISSSECSALQ